MSEIESKEQVLNNGWINFNDDLDKILDNNLKEIYVVISKGVTISFKGNPMVYVRKGYIIPKMAEIQGKLSNNNLYINDFGIVIPEKYDRDRMIEAFKRIDLMIIAAAYKLMEKDRNSERAIDLLCRQAILYYDCIMKNENLKPVSKAIKKQIKMYLKYDLKELGTPDLFGKRYGAKAKEQIYTKAKRSRGLGLVSAIIYQDSRDKTFIPSGWDVFIDNLRKKAKNKKALKEATKKEELNPEKQTENKEEQQPDYETIAKYNFKDSLRIDEPVENVNPEEVTFENPPDYDTLLDYNVPEEIDEDMEP